MVEIIEFPSGNIRDNENNPVEITHKIGRKLSITFEDNKVIITYPTESMNKDSFWEMISAVYFLYSDSEELEEMRMKVLKEAIESGFPFRTEVDVHLDFDFEID